MGKLFGTDGIRGLANVHPVTIEVALRVGRAISYLCREPGESGTKRRGRPRVLIGKDTRRSCYMLENALTAGICSMGGDALLLGPIPTPGIAFLIPNMRAKAGVVISASHNPYEDNGIKIFGDEGYKVPDEVEQKIEALVLGDELDKVKPLTGDKVGRAKRIEDARGRYIVFTKNSFPNDLTLNGVKLVLDCANGATYKVAPEVFWELGAEVETVGTSPNGLNINDECGALFPEQLAEKVVKTGADAGLAFDGDGDRLILVDEKGNVLTGDHVMAICAKEMKARGTLRNNTVVATVMSNVGLTRAAKEIGFKLERTKVGDRFVLETMRELDATLGGEASGHMIFRNHHTTGDGIIAALQVLSVALAQQKPLSELAQVLTMFPQKMVNVEVLERPEIASVPAIAKVITQAEGELGELGRVLVRYSGTQPYCRVMAEGPTPEITVDIVDRIVEVVRREIGAPPRSDDE